MVLADSLDRYGKRVKAQYIHDPDQRDKLLLFSIVQEYYHILTVEFNKLRTIAMTEKEKRKKNRQLTLFTHSALVCIQALQEHQDTQTDPYIKSRCDVLWNKMDKSIS